MERLQAARQEAESGHANGADADNDDDEGGSAQSGGGGTSSSKSSIENALGLSDHQQGIDDVIEASASQANDFTWKVKIKES